MKTIKLELTYKLPDKQNVRKLIQRLRHRLDGLLFVTDKDFVYYKAPTIKVVK